jgi:hypothetical protein
MRFAYADPPYLGCCGLYDHEHGNDGQCWDEPETHRALIARLEDFDGWAMSLSTPSLRTILPMCPEDVRVAAWVKPFAVFKPNVNPAYAWEPVIVRGGRKRGRELATVRDFVSANITLQKGLTGAKPEAFCRWVLAFLNVQDGDEFVDIYPGTNVMAQVRNSQRWQSELFG